VVVLYSQDKAQTALDFCMVELCYKSQSLSHARSCVVPLHFPSQSSAQHQSQGQAGAIYSERPRLSSSAKEAVDIAEEREAGGAGMDGESMGACNDA
jgi:hypothetical protein